SVAAGMPVAWLSSSSAAMPPVPSNCAAMIRSALPGPRRTRNKPSATIASTKPAAAKRKSAIGVRFCDDTLEDCLLRGELGYYGLADIEAMDEELVSCVCAGRYGPRQQAHQGREHASCRPTRKSDRIDHEAGRQREPRIEYPPRDVNSGNYGRLEER